jgi:enoyl-CoA hydratase/carnithine racemase
VLWLTLDRPARLNALNGAARIELASALETASDDPEIGAVVLTGRGDRAFCAGQDLTESAALEADDADRWMDTWRRFFDAVGACRKPLVAAINGTAAGAGLQLALMADLRVGVPDARLLMAEVNVGLPAIVGSHLLEVHLGQSRMRDLVLTGRAVSCREAAAWGLIHGLSAPETLAATAGALAETLAAKPPVALDLTLSFLRRLSRTALADAEAAAVRYQAEAVATGAPQAEMQRFLAARSARRTRPAPEET